MRYFVIVLVLAINVALVKSQGPRASCQAGGSTDGENGDGSVSANGVDTGDTGNSPPADVGDGSSQNAGAGGNIGGCSAGASGNGNAGDANGSADGSTSANCATPGAGYTYEINATRTDNVIAPGNPVLYMYYQVTPVQNLTYFEAVGPKFPLMIEAYITDDDDDNVYFSNDENSLVNSCEKQPEGTWQFVLNEVVKKSLLLGHDCSVKKGNYMIDQTVGPITFTLPEMLKCGKYNIIFNAYAGSSLIWCCQLYFTFEIPESDNCN